MTTATKPRTKVTTKPTEQRANNRFGFYPSCPLDKAEQSETEELNRQADDHAVSVDELLEEYAELFSDWRNRTFNEIVEPAERVRTTVRATRRELEEEREQMIVTRHDIMVRSRGAYRREISRCEKLVFDAETKAVEALRLKGVDGFAMTEFADSNAAAVDDRLRRFTREHDLEVMAAVGLLNMMYEGTITRLNLDRGFGFITAPNQPDVFFHFSDLVDELTFDETLRERRVRFDVLGSAKGLRQLT